KAKREEKTRLANDLVAGNNQALNQIRAEAEAQRGFHVSKLLQLEGELTALEAEADLFRQQERGNVIILRSQVEARINQRGDVRQIQDQLDYLAKKIAQNNSVAANPQIANKKLLDDKAELEARLDKTRKAAFPEEEAQLRRDLTGNVEQHL